jgi:hypothetical protein
MEKTVYFVYSFHSFQATGIYESVCQVYGNPLPRGHKAIYVIAFLSLINLENHMPARVIKS